MLNTFRSKVDEAHKKKNALAAIVEAKKGAQRWRQYSATKRQVAKSSRFSNIDHIQIIFTLKICMIFN